ncbi:hypothetical protein F4777DRAFT_589108 [Nemania sp. FL0916]|nr:hypothetical protein F4777DRAFT_589108 [Nemania sp. FL0916]
MGVARPALSAVGCSQCRSLVLHLFAGTLRSSPVVRLSLSRVRVRAPIAGALAIPIRRLSSLSRPADPASEDIEHEAAPAKTEIETPESVGTETEPTDAASPWYLQVEPPTHIAPLQPPPLPEVPPDAPPLIGSLLEFAAEEIGLSELAMLDLRKLDPPPALGANLFMLFGTARSERHLVVSSGRLVRHLRAKHRIYADADGLLGPNERKLKQSRKARRAKLLGTQGTDNADDGIRTGWICVNLGTINSGSVESAVVADDGRVTGFGVAQTGFTVVFQVMTAGRRAEMDLETLWTRALDRSLSPESNKDPIPRSKPERNSQSVEETMLANLYRPRSSPSNRTGQSSGFRPSNQAHFYSTQEQFRFATGMDPLSTSSPEELSRVLTYNSYQKQRLLDLLRAQLDEMNVKEARATLGDLGRYVEPTPFMQLMTLAMETLSPPRTWEYRLAIQHKASSSGVPAALETLDNVRSLVQELRVYGIQATRRQYLQLLSCIFYVKWQQHADVANLAMDVINTMDQRQEDVMDNELIVAIIEGASRHEASGRWLVDLISRMEQLLYRPGSPYMDEPLLRRLMTAYAYRGLWSKVWFAWGVPPRHLLPRSSDMYIHMLNLATATHSVDVCTHVVRRLLQEAGGENPPVLNDQDMRQALVDCIRVADPNAEEFSKISPEMTTGNLRRLAQREFAKYFRTFKPDSYE